MTGVDPHRLKIAALADFSSGVMNVDRMLSQRNLLAAGIAAALQDIYIVDQLGDIIVESAGQGAPST